MSEAVGYRDYLRGFWGVVGGDETLLGHLNRKGPEQILPSVFDVTSFATASVGAALLAAAELKKVRSESSEFPEVEISSLEACASFKSDSLFQALVWQLPPVWDPFAGDYLCKDGWIRLHTNYRYHRDAVSKVTGVASSREELAQKVAGFEKAQLETEVVNAGGCAAVMYSKKEWDQHPHGRFASQEKILSFLHAHPAKANFKAISKTSSALEGIRVLDLTRVIAGPMCTQFLSAHGAEVLRIDPPGFEEVPALLPLVTTGKKRTFLDIALDSGKKQFEKLIREAHVLVHGLRPDALSNLGFTPEYLEALNPSLIVASLDAYGWEGPWKVRRGFDSLVQMSSGIAAEGMRQKGIQKPFPLPVQALDYGVGYVLAAGVCRALTELYQSGKAHVVRASLVGASNVLQTHVSDINISSPDAEYFKSVLIEDDTAWGKALRVCAPGIIGGMRGSWNVQAGLLGSHAAEFTR